MRVFTLLSKISHFNIFDIELQFPNPNNEVCKMSLITVRPDSHLHLME